MSGAKRTMTSTPEPARPADVHVAIGAVVDAAVVGFDVSMLRWDGCIEFPHSTTMKNRIIVSPTCAGTGS